MWRGNWCGLVDVWSADRDAPFRLEGDDVLDGGNVLPDFTFPVRELFP
jgi:hypothetical protein